MGVPRNRRRLGALGLVLLVASVLAATACAASEDRIVERLRSMVAVLNRTETAVRAGDQAAARAAYQGYRDGWGEIEDEIRPRARDAYREIESEMRNVSASLRAQPLDVEEALTDVGKLRAASLTLIEKLPSTTSSASGPGAPRGITQLMAELDEAAAALQNGDLLNASTRIGQAQELWPDVEGAVKVKSPATYTAVENNLALAEASLRGGSPDVKQAAVAVDALRSDLRPFAEGTLSYLREGLEALLIITGLLAFVKRTATAPAQTWIWGGAGLGVAASLAIAVVLQVALAQVSTGTNRELLEGITGLFAAAMLVYVSYWIHSKANQSAWQRYVGQKTTTALARNSMLSLALIAFLAVFREGGETALFLLGMAPSIALSDLLLGLGAAAALLAVIGVALVGFGVKIPIRPFFLGTSLLLYYLAFKFVGASVHALQVASVASATPAPVPPFELVGLYPTWETTVPQVALLVGAAAVLLIGRFFPRRASVTQA